MYPKTVAAPVSPRVRQPPSRPRCATRACDSVENARNRSRDPGLRRRGREWRARRAASTARRISSALFVSPYRIRTCPVTPAMSAGPHMPGILSSTSHRRYRALHPSLRLRRAVVVPGETGEPGIG